MCPDEEITLRLEQEKGSISIFEKGFQNEQNFPVYAIKRYDRSAANKDMSKPEGVRAPIILYHTVSYIRDIISDQDKIPDSQSMFSYEESG